MEAATPTVSYTQQAASGAGWEASGSALSAESGPPAVFPLETFACPRGDEVLGSVSRIPFRMQDDAGNGTESAHPCRLDRGLLAVPARRSEAGCESGS